MKHSVIAGGLGVLLLAAGCCSLPPAFVSVREAIYRSEEDTTNRLELPLTAPGRESVLQLLRTGRNQTLDNTATMVEPEAEKKYGGLLDLLAGSAPLVVSNLVADPKFKATPAFKPWFPKPALRQVIDAREKYSLPLQPYAYLDAEGKYWWVFYHRQKKLTHVLVTQAAPRKIKR